jgi:signal transduction histidine kinase
MPFSAHWPSLDSTEQRTVAGLRLLLCSAALVVLWIDPTQPETNAPETYAALALYTVYSAALYGASLVESLGAVSFRRFEHWIDIAWCALLVGLSGGPRSLFFVLFFFPILMASFRWGFRAGFAATVVSTALVLLVSAAVALSEGAIDLNRFLLRPVYLGVLGWVISQRGGFETLLKRRLALLKEIGRLSNPRLGTDRTIGSSLERLRAFYDADDCLLLTAGAADEGVRLRRATRDAPERSYHEDPLPAELASTLLAPPAGHALVYPGAREGRAWPWSAAVLQADVESGAPVVPDAALVERLAEWFGPGFFVTVPVIGHGRVVGRLYLSGAPRRVGIGDADFLLQVVDVLLPLLENMRLVDRLAADAAEDERRKIARDVHDSVIQPYIGLQIGLSALERQLGSGARSSEDALRAASDGVRRLLAVTDSGIEDLRDFVARLRGGEVTTKGFAAIAERYARKFTELTGIAVEVEAAEGPLVNDRLAAELFQMMAEGLSNVRRHTEAKRATLRLSESDGALLLAIENDGRARGEPPTFVPRSLADRAKALQGWVEVQAHGAGGTRVLVTIPL